MGVRQVHSRRFLTALVAVVYGVALFGPLAAAASAPAGMPCCRTKSRCCCRKGTAGGVRGQGLVAQTCDEGCGRSTAGFTASGAVELPRGGSTAPAMVALPVIATHLDPEHSTVLADTLQPRPPPFRPSV